MHTCECSACTPGPFRRAIDCLLLPDATPERHVELLAQLQYVHVLVRDSQASSERMHRVRVRRCKAVPSPWCIGALRALGRR